jgi:hypothetical protein
MGSVDRSQLGVASGVRATINFCGQGLSIAILGAIAASKLGPAGGRVILLGESAGVSSAQAFAAGYREAMLAGAGLALAGVLASLVRERRPKGQEPACSWELRQCSSNAPDGPPQETHAGPIPSRPGEPNSGLAPHD